MPRALASVCLLPTVLLALSASGCRTNTLLRAIDEEPQCGDFRFGPARTLMKGSLTEPVQVTIKEGRSMVARVLVLGTRVGPKGEQENVTKVGLPDANAEYTVEWATCANERAPQPVSDERVKDPHAVKYQCGEATLYQTDKLATKKGEPASHAIRFAPPPDSACFADQVPPGAASTAAAGSASASAAPSASASPALALSASAPASASASGAPAAPSGSGSTALATSVAPATSGGTKRP